jgi:hypothetical protein
MSKKSKKIMFQIQLQEFSDGMKYMTSKFILPVQPAVQQVLQDVTVIALTL